MGTYYNNPIKTYFLSVLTPPLYWGGENLYDLV
jgi:hypothetical protein